MLDAIKRKLGKEDLASLVNSQWLILDKIVRIFVGIFLSAWMARILGPRDFGLLNYAVSFAALFFPLTELGLSSILVRELVNRSADKTLLLGSSLWLKLLGGAFGLLVAVSSSLLINRGDAINTLLILIVASSALFQSMDIIDYWFQSRLESKFVVSAKLGAFGLSTLFKGCVLLYHPSLILLAIAILLDSFLNAAALVVIYSVMSGSVKQWRASVKTARGLLGSSAPLVLSGIMKALFLRIDQVMLLQMASPAELGLYSVAVRLSEGFFFLPAILYVSVFPNIVKAKNTSEEMFYRKLQQIYNIMAFMGYGLIVFFILFSKPIIRLLYGDAFSASAEMLMVLAFSLLFINLGTGRGAFLLSMNWTKVHSLTMAGGCLLNILLNLLLIPSMGGMGAAIASVAAYALAGYFSCFFYPPLFRTGLMLTKSILLPKVW
jgi:O-antigen/teichoic acid export membrane protein